MIVKIYFPSDVFTAFYNLLVIVMILIMVMEVGQLSIFRDEIAGYPATLEAPQSISVREHERDPLGDCFARLVAMSVHSHSRVSNQSLLSESGSTIGCHGFLFKSFPRH